MGLCCSLRLLEAKAFSGSFPTVREPTGRASLRLWFVSPFGTALLPYLRLPAALIDGYS